MLASLPESCNRVTVVGAIVRLEGGNNRKSCQQQQNSAEQTTILAPVLATEGPNWKPGLHVNRAFARHVAISLSEDVRQLCYFIRGQ